MTNRKNGVSTVAKIRTVSVNDRGQIVIPGDIRKDLVIEGRSTLVLIEKGGEIIVRKEADVSKALDKDLFWKAVARTSLKRAWSKEDEVWDEIVRKEGI